MSSRRLDAFRVLTFDCYGTLIDWESGIWEALQPLFSEAPQSGVTRSEVLAAFAEEESRQESENEGALYPEILRGVHASLAVRFGREATPGLEEMGRAFGASVGDWPAFPDSSVALSYLKSRYRLVILSNVHRAGIAASIDKLGVEFDAVYTAEEIGSYKPSPRNFEYMLERLRGELGLSRTDVLHTAQSLYHDHVPARALGLSTAWIDRQRLSAGGDWGATRRLEEPPETDFVFFSLAEMADAVRGSSS